MSLKPAVEDYHSLEDDDDDEVTHPFFAKPSLKNVSRKRSLPKTAPSISSARSDSGYSSYTTRTRSTAGSELSFAAAPQSTAKHSRKYMYVPGAESPEKRLVPVHSDDDSHPQAGEKQVRFEPAKSSRKRTEVLRRKRAVEREGILEECMDPGCTTCCAQPGRRQTRDVIGPPPPPPYPPHLPPRAPRHESSQPYSQRYHDQFHHAPLSRSVQYQGTQAYNLFLPWHVPHGGSQGPFQRTPKYIVSESNKGQNLEGRPSYLPIPLENQGRAELEQSPYHVDTSLDGASNDKSTSNPSSEEIPNSIYKGPAHGIERGDKAQYEERMRDIRLFAQAKEKVRWENDAHRHEGMEKRRRYSSCDRRVPCLATPPVNPQSHDQYRSHASIERPQSPKQRNVGKGGLKPPNGSRTAQIAPRSFSLDAQASKYSEATETESEKAIPPEDKFYSYACSNDFLKRGATPGPNVDRCKLNTIQEEKDMGSPVATGDHSDQLFDDSETDDCEDDVDDALQSAMGIVQNLLLRELFNYALPESTNASLESTESTRGSAEVTITGSVSSSSCTKGISSSRSSKRMRGSGRDPGDEDDDNTDDDDRPKKRLGRSFPDRFPQRRLKCPFYQRQPEKYNKAACRGTGFVDMAKLKDHIKRVHTQPLRCSRCWLDMESDEVFFEHLQQIDICQINPEPQEDRIRPQMLKRLDFKKAPYSKTRNVDEKWKIMYAVIFPNDSNIPSPYEQQGMSPQLERALCEALEEELTRELAAVIGPIMTKIKGCIPAILENCRQRLRNSSPSSDDEIIFTPSGTSSGMSSDKTGQGNSTGSRTPLTDSTTPTSGADGCENSPGNADRIHDELGSCVEPMDSCPNYKTTVDPMEFYAMNNGADHDLQVLNRHDSFQEFQPCEKQFGIRETHHDSDVNESTFFLSHSETSNRVVRCSTKPVACTDESIFEPHSTGTSAPEQQTLALADDPKSKCQSDGMRWAHANIGNWQPDGKHTEADLTHDFLAPGDWWESLETDFDMGSII